MIYLIWGKPKHGKTYRAVLLARRALKRGDKTVYSNFPIVTEWGCSKEWKPEYAKENIQNSLIIIDEAYMDYNSRNFSKFTKEEHTFFSLNGHNGNDIIVIAHSPARLDVVIREMVNEFQYVDAVFVPFTSRTLWFKLEAYLDEQAISMRHVSKGSVYYTIRYPFSWKVARSYDYKFYRNMEHFDPSIYPEWDKVITIRKDLYHKKRVSIFETLFFTISLWLLPVLYPIKCVTRFRLYHKLAPIFYKEMFIKFLLLLRKLLDVYQEKISKSKVKYYLDVTYNSDFFKPLLYEDERFVKICTDTFTSMNCLLALLTFKGLSF